MKLVLASHNAGKQKEMAAILAPYGVELTLQSELGVDVEVEETGETFAENALLKARAVMEKTGLPAIADDSGLMVDALGGGPGVYTARYGGEGLSDAERYRLLLSSLTGQTNRAAHFHCCIVCAFPNGDTITAEGVCDGTIAFAPMGTEGFGYDPVFFVPALRKTFAQMGEDEKNQISHRAKALTAFAEKFDTYCKENHIYADK
jgi:XTP/dITP diphosphohydrolase